MSALEILIWNNCGSESTTLSAGSLKENGTLLLAEPAGHVKPDRFQQEVELARQAGLQLTSQPAVQRSLAALFTKKPA